MKLTTFFFIALLLALTVSQTTVVVNCSTNTLDVNPVCIGDTRYLNPNALACSSSANTATVSCPNKKVQDTRVGNSICYCPLLEEITCLKGNSNSGKYLNPCFARCFNPSSGYYDFENCQGSVVVGSSAYRKNQQCLSCNSTYSPICVNNNQFTNSCYATCYQQGQTQGTCSTPFNFIHKVDNANCICINSVNPVCVQQKRYANPCLANCAYPGIQTYPC